MAGEGQGDQCWQHDIMVMIFLSTSTILRLVDKFCKPLSVHNRMSSGRTSLSTAGVLDVSELLFYSH